MKKSGSIRIELFTIIVVLIFFIQVREGQAAYSYLATPENEEYVGDQQLLIRGVAQPDEEISFSDWKLEIGTINEQEEFVTDKILISSSQPTTNPEDELIYTLDLNQYPPGKYALKLTSRDAGGEDVSIRVFYKSQPLTLNIINDFNSLDFYNIWIVLYGDARKYLLVDADPELSGTIKGNGNYDGRAGPITVCKSTCNFLVDMIVVDKKPQTKADIEVLAEDTDGNFYLFYKKYTGQDSLTFSTEETIEQNIPLLADYFTNIIQKYFTIEGYNYFPTDKEDDLTLRIAYDERLRYKHPLIFHHIGNTPNGEGDVGAIITPPLQGQAELTQSFIRGDASRDGKIDITDAVYTLNHLFLGGSKFKCEDAADANDNGKIDITDAVYTLNHLFLGGPDFPSPYKTEEGAVEAGFDPTLNDHLNCYTK